MSEKRVYQHAGGAGDEYYCPETGRAVALLLFGYWACYQGPTLDELRDRYGAVIVEWHGERVGHVLTQEAANEWLQGGEPELSQVRVVWPEEAAS